MKHFPQHVQMFLDRQAPNGKKTSEYLAELIILNGGNSNVTSFGEVKPTKENRFGRVGLTIQEAFHLNQITNFLNGILFVLGSPELEIDVMQAVLVEVEKVKTGSLLYLPTGEENRLYGR